MKDIHYDRKIKTLMEKVKDKLDLETNYNAIR